MMRNEIESVFFVFNSNNVFFVFFFSAKRRNLSGFDTSPKPSTSKDKSGGAYKRLGGGGSNIHRLNDLQDSEDENNTWNGNSTQQQ